MKYLIYLIFIGLVIACNNKPKETTSTPVEPAKPKWESIFNGNDLTNWKIKFRGEALGINYKNTFVVEDNIIKVKYDEYESFDENFGHLFYDRKLSNYRLRLEYRFVGEQVPGGEGWAYKNSGVMFHTQSPESMGVEQPFPVCLEAQFLGGKDVDRPTGNLCTPGTHVTLADTLLVQHCVTSNSKTYYGEEWVTAELIVYGDSIFHHVINGDTVLTYGSPVIGGTHLPENYDVVEGTLIGDGYFALQAESHPVHFRHIELMELD